MVGKYFGGKLPEAQAAVDFDDSLTELAGRPRLLWTVAKWTPCSFPPLTDLCA